MEWQPIETVPRDGSKVLLFHHSGGVDVRHWDESMKLWYPGGCSDGWHTHWMPLPDSPSSAKVSGGGAFPPSA